LKRRLSLIDKNIAIITSDTGQNAKTRSGFLPGGVVSIIKGQSVGLIDVEKEKHSKLGNWHSFRLKKGNNHLQIINMYHIPDSLEEGVIKSRA